MHRILSTLLLLGTFSPLPTPVRAPVSFLPAVAPPFQTLSLSANGLSASGVLLIDLRSGQRLLKRDARTPRPIASLVKIMTALLLIERGDPEAPVLIPAGVGAIDGTTIGLLEGKHYRARDLLAALLVGSGNDAAEALALHHSPSVADFVRAMNVRARVLGLRSTTFRNPSGLDALGQESTPEDLAWLTSYALRFPLFRELVSSSSWRLTPLEGGTPILVVNTNQLLHTRSRAGQGVQINGVKTGTTVKAGECLISLADIDGREVLLILLKSSQRYRDAQALLRELSQILA